LAEAAAAAAEDPDVTNLHKIYMSEQKATGQAKAGLEKQHKKRLQLQQELQDLAADITLQEEALADQEEKERRALQNLNAQKQKQGRRKADAEEKEEVVQVPGPTDAADQAAENEDLRKSLRQAMERIRLLELRATEEKGGGQEKPPEESEEEDEEDDEDMPGEPGEKVEDPKRPGKWRVQNKSKKNKFAAAADKTKGK